MGLYDFVYGTYRRYIGIVLVYIELTKGLRRDT